MVQEIESNENHLNGRKEYWLRLLLNDCALTHRSSVELFWYSLMEANGGLVWTPLWIVNIGLQSQTSYCIYVCSYYLLIVWALLSRCELIPSHSNRISEQQLHSTLNLYPNVHPIPNRNPNPYCRTETTRSSDNRWGVGGCLFTSRLCLLIQAFAVTNLFIYLLDTICLTPWAFNYLNIFLKYANYK